MIKSAVLKIPDFSILFCARILATMALQAQAVMVGWYIYELSKDPLMLGLIGLVEAIPAIGFSFLAGHIVDNSKPASIYRYCVSLLFLDTLVIWIISFPSMNIPTDLRLVILFLSVFMSGLVRSFSGPSVFTLVSYIVPRKLLPEAAAWGSGSFQSAAILGPALGGILYGSFGPVIAFGAPPVLMIGSIVATLFFSKKALEVRSSAKREPFVESVLAGIQFVREQKVLLSTMVLDMFSVLFGGAIAILPMFSDQVLHMGSQGLGFLRAAPSLGSALTALFLGLVPLRTISGKMLLWVVAGFGVATIGFAFSTTFALAFFFLAISGAFDGVSMVIRNTILQLLTPDHMRGRVSSLSSIFITSSNEIGSFESGVAAKVFGLIPSILIGGSLTMFVVATTAWFSPKLRHTNIHPDLERH